MNCIIIPDWHYITDATWPNIAGMLSEDIWLATQYGDIFKARVFLGENSCPGRVGLCTPKTDPKINNDGLESGAYGWFDWGDLQCNGFIRWAYWSPPGFMKSRCEAEEELEEIYGEDDI